MHSYIAGCTNEQAATKVIEEEQQMEFTPLEKKLLEKLARGTLDGFILPDIQWKSEGLICRRMIVGGIPYYISFMEKPDYGNVAFVIEQFYETDEMKLWFLKRNGEYMNDPDVAEYCASTK